MYMRQKVWANSVAVLLLATAILGASVLETTPAYGEMVQLWQAGLDNDTNEEFGQENNVQNSAPGSATAKDDDWYFAGTYDAPIGTLADDEPLDQFERALTTGDTTNRIHFILSAEEAAALNKFQLVVQTLHNDTNPDYPDDVPLNASFNGNVVLNAVVNMDGEQEWISDVFTAESVGAVEGENVVSITREAATGQRRWIQFDLVRLDIEAVPEPSTLALGLLGLLGLALYGWKRKN